MAGTRIQGACDAFEVVVDQPRRGDRELRVEVVFSPDGPTDRATIQTRLYCRRLGWVIRRERSWDTESGVPGTKALLERGETGRLRFTRPLPAFVTPYRGRILEITPVLVTEGDDGSRVRLDLSGPPVAEDARLVVRGLPRSERVRPKGLLGRLRGGEVLVGVHEGHGSTVAVSVEGSHELTGGRARLEAVEYRREIGHYMESDPPVARTEATMLPAGPGRLRAVLPLPEATAAPASITCSWAHSRQGIKWVARLDLENSRGRVTRVELPLHVGVERDAAQLPAAG